MSFRLLLVAVLAALVLPAQAQSFDVTFRFIPDLTAPAISPVARAFVPGTMPEGTMNDWGPNAAGVIQPGAASQATYVSPLNEYRYTVPLAAGAVHMYKVHYHQTTPTTGVWITDPLGTETTGDNNDSVVRVTDPMVFQVAREQNGTSRIQTVSAGVFGSADVASVRFTVNGTVYTTGITDAGDGVYSLDLPAPVAPGAFVKVEATDTAGRTARAEVGQVPPTVTDAPVPAGLEDGITYDPTDPTRATLVLRAPGKGYVYALGSFNGWTADGASLMKRDAADPLGTRWWVELTGLTPGQEQTFYYLVDGLIRVADPYTTKVYYPGEARYPAGAQEHAVGVLRPGAPAYPWTDGDFQAPAQDELVVYELLLRDFLRAHSYTALTDTLDYLDRLGINAIELMPVSEYDGDESWGYNPAFHLALDKYYGTPEQFKAFVDAAHARGIAVLLDVVYNHATGQSPLIRLYNEGTFGRPTADNPWANVTARHPFNVFNDLNHESPLTQIWLDKANRFWMDEYHIDGFRYDLSKGFTQTNTGDDVGAWGRYDASRVALLTRMADALWAQHPDAVVILEHFAEAREETELARHGRDQGRRGMTLWSNLNDPYMQAAMGYNENSDLRRAYAPNNGYPAWGQIAYMESHDEQWVLYKVRTFGNRTAAYDTRALPTALDRKELATAFFLTLPGPRMLWQFGEVGYGGGPGECLQPNNDCPPGTPGRVSNKPIRWDYWADVAPFANGVVLPLTKASDAERADRRDLYGVTSTLLALRERYPLFRSADTGVSSRLGSSTLDRWIKLSLPSAGAGEPRQAVVVGNFGVTEATVTPGFPAAGTYYEAFSGEAFEVTDTGVGLRLAPGEYRLYTDVRVSGNPVAGEDGPAGDLSDGIVSVFPNPVAGGRATARIEVGAARHVRVEVFDALGRRVATLADRAFGPGEHDLAFSTAGLPAGVYIVRWEGRAVPVTVAR